MSKEEKCYELGDALRNFINQCIFLETSMFTVSYTPLQVGYALVATIATVGALLMAYVQYAFHEFQLMTIISNIIIFFIGAAMYATFFLLRGHVKKIGRAKNALREKCLKVLRGIDVESLCISDKELIKLYEIAVNTLEGRKK